MEFYAGFTESSYIREYDNVPKINVKSQVTDQICMHTFLQMWKNICAITIYIYVTIPLI